MLATPELIAQAATDLTAIDSTLAAAQVRAARSTQALLPAAADEVSAGITRLFTQQAEDFQNPAAQASAYHEQFVQKMGAAAGAYAGAEAVNADWLLQPLETIVGQIVALGVPGLINVFLWILSLPEPFPSILLFPFIAPFAIALLSLFLWLFVVFPLIITVTPRPLLEAIFSVIFP